MTAFAWLVRPTLRALLYVSPEIAKPSKKAAADKSRLPERKLDEFGLPLSRQHRTFSSFPLRLTRRGCKEQGVNYIPHRLRCLPRLRFTGYIYYRGPRDGLSAISSDSSASLELFLTSEWVRLFARVLLVVVWNVSPLPLPLLSREQRSATKRSPHTLNTADHPCRASVLRTFAEILQYHAE